jgi:hypothetical protein
VFCATFLLILFWYEWNIHEIGKHLIMSKFGQKLDVIAGTTYNQKRLPQRRYCYSSIIFVQKTVARFS